MKTSWTKGLDEVSSEDIRGAFKASLLLRKRLKHLLLDKMDASNKNCRAKLSYDNPNWALLQADQRGYERALHELIELVE